VSIRGLLELFDNTIVVDKEVAPDLEACRILSSNNLLPVFFQNLNGQKAVGNLFSMRGRIQKVLGVNQKQLIENMAAAIDAPSDPVKRTEAPFLENRSEDFDLRELAIPKYYPKDGGRYLTSSVVIGQLDGIRNLSFHRMMILDERRMAIRLVPRDLYNMHKKSIERGKDLPIAIVIGLCPSILLPAAMSVDYGIDELRIANTLRKLCLDQEVHVVDIPNGITVPAYSEIVMEGRITGQMIDEGPFVDITGTVDYVRKQPVVEIDAINQRDDAIMQLLLPAGSEHRILMGMPKEPVILSGVRKVVADVHGVNLTEGGCGWLHGVVAITKQIKADSKNAGMAALKAHKSMKMVIIVDDDINVFDPAEVEWAIAIRFQADKDLTILENQKGSSLDPSSGGKMTSKMILDATIKSAEKEPFQKAGL